MRHLKSKLANSDWLSQLENNKNNELQNELLKQEMDLVGIDSRRLVIL